MRVLPGIACVLLLASGALAQGSKTIDYTRARRFWSFQPLKDVTPPAVQNAAWAESPIDRFVMARLEAKGLQPAAPADRQTLLRRLYLDLIGLPPTPQELSTQDDLEQVVDTLLASPHYGERWARHWLDLVRYAETDGHEFDVDKPNAWRYRDYVIRAFQEDLPYDRFLTEQIAGDLLGGERATIASGFLWLGEVINTPVDSVKALADRIDNQIDVTGKTFLGLTVACARCHDHKFDPIPAADYYAMAGFMHSSRRRQALVSAPADLAMLRKLGPLRSFEPAPATPDAKYQLFDDLDSFEKWTATGQAFGSEPVNGIADSSRYSDALQGILISRQFTIPKRFIHVRLAGKGEFRLVADEYTNKGRIVSGTDAMEWKTIDARMGQGNLAYFEIADQTPSSYIAVDRIVFSDEKTPPADAPAAARLLRRDEPVTVPEPVYALAAVDDQPQDARLYPRGDHTKPGDTVARRFLTVFSGDSQPAIAKGSGRLELARRMLEDARPLVARVMVNRIWQSHFGAGIVRTPDNFGLTGDTPTHPELLDWLAAEFIRSGWSVKHMHRLILNSHAYRMSSHAPADAARIDPENKLLHHMPVRRLEAEVLRDQMLAVSGSLDRTLFGPSVSPYVSPFMDGDPRGKPKSGPVDGANRRSIYIQVRRNYLTDMFVTFDCPQPITTIGRRNVSTVASQALYMMNSEFAHQQAERWAKRITGTIEDPAARLDRMYLEAFSRRPEESERAQALQFVRSRSWTDLAHVLMNTTEFLYVR